VVLRKLVCFVSWRFDKMTDVLTHLFTVCYSSVRS